MRPSLRIVLLALSSVLVLSSFSSIRPAPAACTDSECSAGCNCHKKGNAQCPGADRSCNSPLCERIWLAD